MCLIFLPLLVSSRVMIAFYFVIFLICALSVDDLSDWEFILECLSFSIYDTFTLFYSSLFTTYYFWLRVVSVKDLSKLSCKMEVFPLGITHIWHFQPYVHWRQTQTYTPLLQFALFLLISHTAWCVKTCDKCLSKSSELFIYLNQIAFVTL